MLCSVRNITNHIFAAELQVRLGMDPICNIVFDPFCVRCSADEGCTECEPEFFLDDYALVGSKTGSII